MKLNNYIIIVFLVISCKLVYSSSDNWKDLWNNPNSSSKRYIIIFFCYFIYNYYYYTYNNNIGKQRLVVVK
jgi:hypothetical protein